MSHLQQKPPAPSLTHYFAPISTDLKHIAIGGPGFMWGITTANKLVSRYLNTMERDWVTMPDLPNKHVPLTLDCAEDGTVIVLDTANNAYRYSDLTFPGTEAPHAPTHWLKLSNAKWTDVGVGGNDAIVGIRKVGDGGMPQLYLGNGQLLNMLSEPLDGLTKISVAHDKTVVGIANLHQDRLLFDHPPQMMTPYWAGELAISAGSSATVLGSDLRNLLRLYTGEHSYAIIDCKDATLSARHNTIKGVITNIACLNEAQYYITVANGGTTTTYARVTNP